MTAHRPLDLPASLLCHPTTPGPADTRLSVALAATQRDAIRGLELTYTLEGPLDELTLPAPAPPGPADGLWQHTCFEAFVGVSGESAYREFNFSPSGQWAAYRFSHPRQRDPAAESPFRPQIDWQTGERGLTMRVWLPLHALPPAMAGQGWDLGLSTVLESADGRLSYWALSHPGERPDFHHRGGWLPLPKPLDLFPTVSAPS